RIGDRAGLLVLRHIEIDAHEHAFAREVEVTDGLERHGSNGGWRESESDENGARDGAQTGRPRNGNKRGVSVRCLSRCPLPAPRSSLSGETGAAGHNLFATLTRSSTLRLE